MPGLDGAVSGSEHRRRVPFASLIFAVSWMSLVRVPFRKGVSNRVVRGAVGTWVAVPVEPRDAAPVLSLVSHFYHSERVMRPRAGAKPPLGPREPAWGVGVGERWLASGGCESWRVFLVPTRTPARRLVAATGWWTPGGFAKSARRSPVSGAGIMLMSGDVPAGSVCTTNDVSALIEQLQYELGEGPCVDAHPVFGFPVAVRFGAARGVGSVLRPDRFTHR